MMKKKNIAMAMAATMVAGTVAPVMATSATTEEKTTVVRVGDERAVNEVIEKVEKYLPMVYTDTTKKVYEIKLNGEVITKKSQLESKLTSMTPGQNLTLTIKDNGHEIDEEGNILDKAVAEYTKQDLYDLASNDNENLKTGLKGDTHSVVVPDGDTTTKSVTVDLKDIDAEIKAADSAKIDSIDVTGTFDGVEEIEVAHTSGGTIDSSESSIKITAKDKDGKQVGEVVNTTAATTSDKQTAEAEFEGIGSVSFKLVTSEDYVTTMAVTTHGTMTPAKGTKLDSKTDEFKIVLNKFLKETSSDQYEVDPAKDETITVTLKEGMKITDFTPELLWNEREGAYEITGLATSKEGTDIEESIETIVFSHSEEKELDVDTIFNGTDLTEEFKTFIESLTAGTDYTVGDVVENKDKTAQVSIYIKNIKLQKSKAVSTPEQGTIYELVVKADDKEQATKFRNVLLNGTNFNEISGEDRFETAIKVSKERFEATNKGNTANAIILVNEDAVVDGLAAAPLAADKKAPILFTKADAIGEKTMAEIKRAMNLVNGGVAGKTVYLVGGESRISPKIQAELKALGLNVKRLAGDDRFETSLQIAKEIDTTSKKAFVVGGDGLADAMSVSGIAANTETPIIVSPKAGLTDNAKKYLKDTTRITEVNMIGGDAVLEEQVEKDIKASNIRKVDRTYGIGRKETNAKVVDKFANKSANTVYVAKEGENKENTSLVDALAAAPLVKDAPLFLATEKLADEQATVAGSLASVKKVTQVGGGVQKPVIERIMDRLGL